MVFIIRSSLISFALLLLALPYYSLVAHNISLVLTYVFIIFVIFQSIYFIRLSLVHRSFHSLFSSLSLIIVAFFIVHRSFHSLFSFLIYRQLFSRFISSSLIYHSLVSFYLFLSITRSLRSLVLDSRSSFTLSFAPRSFQLLLAIRSF